MTDDWKENLRQKMQDFQSKDIPEGLWEGIEEELTGNAAGQRRRVLPLWKHLAAAASFLLIIGSAITLMHFSNQQATQSDSPMIATQGSKPAAETQENVPSPALQSTKHSEKELLAAITSTSRNPQTPARAPQQQRAESKDELTLIADNTVSTEPILKEAPLEQTEAALSENLTQDNSPALPSEPATYAASEFDSRTSVWQESDDRSASHGFSLGFFASSMSDHQLLGRSGYLALSDQSMPENHPLFTRAATGTLNYMALSNALEKPVSDIHHDQPIRTGLSIGYDINPHWAVNTGIAYTTLHSTLTSGTEHSYYSNDQTVRYIGIPFNATYNIVNTHHLRFYASAGAMAEYSTGGDVCINTITNNQLILTEERKLQDIPMQFSVNTAVGIEYLLNNNLGVFAEPGLSYFLDNDSPTTTIYTAHPLNLNLQLGLRWNISN